MTQVKDSPTILKVEGMVYNFLCGLHLVANNIYFFDKILKFQNNNQKYSQKYQILVQCINKKFKTRIAN